MKHLQIKVYGQVQGIGFRYRAREKAQKLKICGFAQNELDGSVYLEAEGSEKDLKKFLDWCQKGPLFAKVTKVDFEFTEEFKNFDDFFIK